MFERMGAKLKVITYVIFAITAIAGIVGSIYVMLFISVALGLFCVVLTFLLSWIATWFPLCIVEITEKVNHIEKTMITKNSVNELTKLINEKKDIGVDEYKCKKCGRINKKYIKTCACGEVKED